MSSVCIAVDSACDLSPEFIAENDIKVLPISVMLENRVFLDTRDPDATVMFYQHYADNRGKEGYAEAETQPLSVEEISSVMEEELTLKYDAVQVITINAKRSKLFDNTNQAAFINLPKFKAIHRQAHPGSSFRLRVLDSTTLFTGQAVLVREAVRLVKEEKLGIGELQAPLEAIRSSIRAYVVPEDLFYLHTRASTKGDNSVGWLSYKLGNMLNVKPIIQCVDGETSPCDKAAGFDKALNLLFDRAEQAIEAGLRTPFVAMSYAGDLNDVKMNERYQRFVNLTQSLKIETMLSVMSATAGINVGPRSFSLAYAEA